MDEEEIIFSDTILLHRRKKDKTSSELVNRGKIKLSVYYSSQSGRFRFVGHAWKSLRVILNASPLPTMPIPHGSKKNTILLYLNDFSSHHNLKRIFYFTFSNSDDAENFMSTIDDIYREYLLTADSLVTPPDAELSDDEVGDSKVDVPAKEETYVEDREEQNNVENEKEDHMVENGEEDDELETQRWPNNGLISPYEIGFPYRHYTN